MPSSQTTSRSLTPEQVARAAGFRQIAGVDEAGRGPWAGPVVAAAVLLARPIRGVRIDDSKRLSPRGREQAFERILGEAHTGIGIVCAQDIDRRNILQATFVAMQQAIQDLPVSPDMVLVDGSLPPPLDIPCWPITHGDARSHLIACASIVAKVIRDRLMAFYHHVMPHYRFDHHKGYGTAAHRAALLQWGPSVLHRMSFEPVAALLPRAQDPTVRRTLAS